MRLLVTGGAGFIGSHFIRYILQSQPDVRVINVDDLTYAGNLENLAPVSDDPRYTFVRANILESDRLKDHFRQQDAVIHFAAESHVDRSILEASNFVETNVSGTQALLETARQSNVPRFLHVSTDEVYGTVPAPNRATEKSRLAPSNPYSASKAASDLMAHAYHVTYGMDIVVTRCSNNYGPYQFPEKLIPLMLLNTFLDQPLPLYGDGLNARDWINVRCHCEALECVLIKGRSGQVYNIGTGKERSNLEVVGLILEILDKSPDLIRFVQDRPGHDRRYAMDITRIREELGWASQRSFDRGLRETVRWYEENLDWVQRVQTGTYQQYYRKMYQDRDQTLSNL